MDRFNRCLTLLAVLLLVGCRTGRTVDSTCERPQRVTLNVSASAVTATPASVTANSGDCIEFHVESATPGTDYTLQRVEFESRPGSAVFGRTVRPPSECDSRSTSPAPCLTRVSIDQGSTAYRVYVRDPARRQRSLVSSLGIVINCPAPKCEIVMRFKPRR